jgi:hypothetical protein
MKIRLLVVGLAIWFAATVLLRLAGQRILAGGDWQHVVVLFTSSLIAVALLVRLACIRAGLAPEEWLNGAVSLLLPTMLLDPFSSAFFSFVYPNMRPENAGVFGGWMIICCAGGLLGGVHWSGREARRAPHEPSQSS